MLDQFRELTSESAAEFEEYAGRRPMYICEAQFLTQYIWAELNELEYTTTDRAMYFVFQNEKKHAALMPFCAENEIRESFLELEEYFEKKLQMPLKILCADETFAQAIAADPELSARYEVAEDRRSFDYIYDAESLRTLAGKKLHKKKNNLNHFMRDYEGRYEYRDLTCANILEIEEYQLRWVEERNADDPDGYLDVEEQGIFKVFLDCANLDCKMGGIYIDGKLEAYSIGSLNERLSMADIQIEKANPEIRGLYTMINQQFLVHAFPEVTLVNREDDMGEEGLRQAKESYMPLRLEKKYTIRRREECPADGKESE